MLACLVLAAAVMAADAIASLEQIPREALDQLAYVSQQRAARAIAEGRFDRSLVPVYKEDGSLALDREEFPRPQTTLEGLAQLAPSFGGMADIPLDFGRLEKHGGFVGSHAVVILSAKDDMKAVALNLLPSSPAWLAAIRAMPMYLGLDLRGGVHFLLQVDMKAAVTKRLDGMAGDIRTTLRDKNLRHSGISREG